MMTLLLLLLGSIIFVPITKKLGLSAILGHLLAGLVVGPSFLNLIHDVEQLAHLSELGIALFMFLIGIELTPQVLTEFRKGLLRFGVTQVSITTLFFFLILYWLGPKTLTASILLSCSFALSSTAMGLQLLKEKQLMKSASGQASTAILIFQDLAIVPMLALIGLLAPDAGQSSNLSTYLGMIVVVLGIMTLGKPLMRFIFQWIAKTQVRELFTSISLLVVLCLAFLMESVGLSMAFGSFLAGLLLADSEFRYEIEISIEPFKGLLMGLFFMTIGMGMNLDLLISAPLWLLALALSLILMKASVLFLMSSFYQMSLQDRLIMALTTSQVGEFAFLLMNKGKNQGIISAQESDLFSLTVALTMALTPVLFLIKEKLDHLFPKLLGHAPLVSKQAPKELPEFDQHKSVILAGFGRMGTIVARMLQAQGIHATILDNNLDQINLVKKFGFKAYYGDATRLELLQAAGAKEAQTLIITFADLQVTKHLCELVQQKFPHLHLIARVKSRNDVYGLKSLGVPSIVRETFGSALEMGQETLLSLGFHPHEVARFAHRFRYHDEKYLEESFAFYEQEDELIGLAQKSKFELERTLSHDREVFQRARYWMHDPD